jgi:pimeloyl-ACP methyl ester carboxylesterase
MMTLLAPQSRSTAERSSKNIVLIHGLWMTPRSWDRFRDRYEAKGFKVLAPPWPRLNGDVNKIRRNPSTLNGLGLAEITEHYEKIVRSLDEPPILIGHSMGGLVVQILLDRLLGAAGIGINAAAPRGIFRLPFSVLKAAAPVLSNPLNYWHSKMLTFEQFKYAFTGGMSDKDAQAAYDLQVIPGPGRPIFEGAFANFVRASATEVNRRNNHRAPLLLIASANDRLVSPVLNQINAQLYKASTAITNYKEFDHRSHLSIAQEGWEEIADFSLDWALSMIHSSPIETRAVKSL